MALSKSYSCGVVGGIGLVCLAALCPTTHADADDPSAHKSYSVSSIGAMMTVHRDGDARPRTALEPPAHRAGGFALGPVGGLRGEITVLDGEPYVARAVGGEQRVERTWDVDAPFLVYGHVDRWAEFPLPVGIRSLPDLQALLPEAAAQVGLDAKAPFPFKLECTDAEIEFHIISNEEPGFQTTRPHSELMRHFRSVNEPVSLIGVYSTEHAGVFTHHGESMHIHMVSQDRKQSGHVDTVKFAEGTTLFLPVP